MSADRKNKLKTERRALRTRARIQSAQALPRISVFKSARHIYAQIIDDTKGETIASCSTLELTGLAGDKRAIAHSVGLELANRAKDKGVAKAVFDRGSFLYHGRVKSLAEGLREGGLKI